MLDEKAGFSQEFIKKHDTDDKHNEKINRFLVYNATNLILSHKFGEDWAQVLLGNADLKISKYKEISDLREKMDSCGSLSELENFCQANNLDWLDADDMESVARNAVSDAIDAQD